MSIVPDHGRIEIGHIAFGAPMQRTPRSTEAVYLLAKLSFDLGNRRLEWKCNNANARSKRAAQRFGFVFEGVFRKHLVVKDHNRDTAWYSITDDEWPQVAAGFERWLSTENQRRGRHERLKPAAGTDLHHRSRAHGPMIGAVAYLIRLARLTTPSASQMA